MTQQLPPEGPVQPDPGQAGAGGNPPGQAPSAQALADQDTFMPEPVDRGLEEQYKNMYNHFNRTQQQLKAAIREAGENSAELVQLRQKAETLEAMLTDPDIQRIAWERQQGIHPGSQSPGAPGGGGQAQPAHPASPDNGGSGVDWTGMDLLETDGATVGKAVEQTASQIATRVAQEQLAAVIEQQLKPVLQGLAAKESTRSQREQVSELQQMSESFADFDNLRDKALAFQKQYGAPLEQAYRAVGGNGLSREQAASASPSPTHMGRPAMQREKATNIGVAAEQAAEELGISLPPGTFDSLKSRSGF